MDFTIGSVTIGGVEYVPEAKLDAVDEKLRLAVEALELSRTDFLGGRNRGGAFWREEAVRRITEALAKIQGEK